MGGGMGGGMGLRVGFININDMMWLLFDDLSMYVIKLSSCFKLDASAFKG